MSGIGSAGLVPPRQQRAIDQAEQRLAVLIWARGKLAGSQLLAEDALDMLVRDEALQLGKMKGLRPLRSERQP